MLTLLPLLNQKRIVLASASPRRGAILKQLGLHFEVAESGFLEDLPHCDPPLYVQKNAHIKAQTVFKSLYSKKPDVYMVIGSDTVVVLDNKILEKPKDKEDAINMLRALSGRTHQVYTGVCVIVKAPEVPHSESKEEDHSVSVLVHTFHQTTSVQFDQLSDETIRAYVDTQEPLDKAGGYGIQGIGGCLVRGLTGCYFNVMGFPLNLFCSEVAKGHADNFEQWRPDSIALEEQK